jgi:hypothetical protein
MRQQLLARIDAVALRLPPPARNTYIVLRAMVEGFRPEFVRLGIITDSPWIITWAGRVYAVLVFALAVFFVPSGNKEAIFSALLALGVAWLLAVPLSASRLTEDDIKLLEVGLLRPGKASLEAIAKLGVRFEISDPTELARAGAIAQKVAAYLTPVVALQLLYRSAVRASILGVLAIVGLGYWPTLASIRVLSRGLDTVLLAVCGPMALRLLSILILPVLLQLILAAFRADQALASDEPKPADSG